MARCGKKRTIFKCRLKNKLIFVNDAANEDGKHQDVRWKLTQWNIPGNRNENTKDATEYT